MLLLGNLEELKRIGHKKTGSVVKTCMADVRLPSKAKMITIP